MKKTLSIVLALALALAAFSSFALVATPADPTSPFVLTGIKVTDAAGYATPYVAVDNAAAFVENQAAYVVVCAELRDNDDYKTYSGPPREIKVTSATLDLSYALDTDKAFSQGLIGGIWPFAPFDPSLNVAKDVLTIKYMGPGPAPLNQPTEAGKVIKYTFAFMAITKPATAGLVKAALTVDPTEFIPRTGPFGPYATLLVYDGGVLKYTINHYNGNDYAVYAGEFDPLYVAKNYLFTYDEGLTVIYDLPGWTTGWNYAGRLIAKNPSEPDKDLTDTVNAVNAFFGFNFALSGAAGESDFEAKTGGNPIVVSDTYNYVTAVVTLPDDEIEIAPTGDFSANIVIVMAASAILAAAALAFVAKKARD